MTVPRQECQEDREWRGDSDPLYQPSFIDEMTNSELADIRKGFPFVVRAGISVARIYSVRARACVAPPLGTQHA